MKKTLRISLIVVAFLFVAGLVKDLAIKSLVSIVATQITGAKVKISGFSFGIFKHAVRINNFRMYNPRGFPKGVLIDVPRAAIDYDLLSIIKGKLHLYRMDVELREIGLERNKEGKLNVDSLKIVQQSKPKEPGDKKPGKPLAIQIDLLNLQMGRIVYKDYSGAREPTIQVYDINLKKSYRNITSAQQLVTLILTESMKQAGIKGAEIYGVALLAGVGVIPVAIISEFMERDSAKQNFNISIDNLYKISLRVIKGIGKVTTEDEAGGVIAAQVKGVSVTVKLKKLSAGGTQIRISARKFMLPKPEIASGILYQISDEIK